MDAAAARLRETNPYPAREDLQIEFRQIQKARMPELSREQWLELFGVWLERDLGRLKRDSDAARQRVLHLMLGGAGIAARHAVCVRLRRAGRSQRS